MEFNTDFTEALRQVNERFHLVLNGSDKLAIQGYTADGTITFWNRASELLYGHTKEEALGKNILDLLHTEESRHEERALMDDILDTGISPPPSELQIVTSTGQPVWIYCNRMLVRQPGQPPEFFCFDVDITEHKQAELALSAMQRLESLGVLAGGIAHDFNNVLAGVFGHLELAQQHLAPDTSAYAHINTARLALERAISLTRQLLTFSKGGAPIMGCVNLQKLIEETVHFNLSASNIQSHCTIHPQLQHVQGDHYQLERVFANLIINAREAMPHGGAVHIHAENCHITAPHETLTPGTYAKITLRDEGCGITAETTHRIFEPYFSTKPTGNGLGLSIVHSIIKKHRGNIEVVSLPGAGTSFTVWLPAVGTHEAPHHTPDQSTTTLNRALRVLVMDDDDLILAYLDAALMTRDHHVTTVVNGESAIASYRAAFEAGHPFDIVILDLTIRGGMGGQLTAQKLLALDPDARMIVTSGYSKNATLDDFRQYGFKGRLEKPFQMDALFMEIERVMS